MKTITLIGLGALGSHIALAIRNVNASIRIIDFDRVESKNIQSQLHTYMGLGKNKAVALQRLVQGLFKKQYLLFSNKLEESNTDSLLNESDLILDCTDNFEARTLIQSYAKETPRTACLHCCLSAEGNLARFIWSEKFTPDAESEEGQATCEDGEMLPFYVQAAAVATQIALNYFKEGKKESWQLNPFGFLRIA